MILNELVSFFLFFKYFRSVSLFKGSLKRHLSMGLIVRTPSQHRLILIGKSIHIWLFNFSCFLWFNINKIFQTLSMQLQRDMVVLNKNKDYG